MLVYYHGGGDDAGIFLTTAAMDWFEGHYGADRGDWRASPLLAEGLAGVAPAVVLTCEYDPLRAEGDEYAQRLRAAGVPVTHRSYPGLVHGVLGMGALVAGAYTPATGVGVAFRFTSHSPFSGVHSAQLDTLLLKASGTTTTAARDGYYKRAAALIAKEAWGPFLFPINGYDTVIHGAGAPGLSTPLDAVDVVPAILWRYAYNNNS